MSEYTDVNGTPFSDEDIERWAAESEAGFAGKHLGPSVAGRPVSVGAQVRPFTLRLDAARRAKLDDEAQARHIMPSQLMRDFIDSL